MPLGETLKALIPLIGSLGGAAMQMGGQSAANRRNRREANQAYNMDRMSSMVNYMIGKQDWHEQNEYNEDRWNVQNAYNEQRYEIEKQDAIDMWHMQNKYNSPIEQMSRLQDAGLNPHLIYGKASMGNADAINLGGITAGEFQQNNMPGLDAKGYNRADSQSVTRGLDIYGDYMRFKNLQAQTDNVEQNTDLAKQQVTMTQIKQLTELLTQKGIKYDTQGKMWDAHRKREQLKKDRLDYGVQNELRDTTIEIAKEKLEQLKQLTRKETLQSDILDEKKVYLIQQAQKEVELAASKLKGEKLKQKLDEIQLKLKKQGIDDAWWLVKAMYQQGKKIPNVFGKKYAPKSPDDKTPIQPLFNFGF